MTEVANATEATLRVAAVMALALMVAVETVVVRAVVVVAEQEREVAVLEEEATTEVAEAVVVRAVLRMVVRVTGDGCVSGSDGDVGCGVAVMVTVRVA